MISSGSGFEDLFGQNDDVIGLGMAWGQPFDRALRDLFTLEAFYPVTIALQMQLSPDIQVIVNSSNDPSRDAIGGLGSRMRLLF